MKEYRQNVVFRTAALSVLLLLTLGVSAQTWEMVRDSEDYIYGEGLRQDHCRGREERTCQLDW